mmetsp:Transcript_6032/g.10453  ORF Transcript_6032/g.10453 Transcript_6032/m.10453 type:complete len:323 (+) Transcript_6032:613-1581(+)
MVGCTSGDLLPKTRQRSARPREHRVHDSGASPEALVGAAAGPKAGSGGAVYLPQRQESLHLPQRAKLVRKVLVRGVLAHVPPCLRVLQHGVGQRLTAQRVQLEEITALVALDPLGADGVEHGLVEGLQRLACAREELVHRVRRRPKGVHVPSRWTHHVRFEESIWDGVVARHDLFLDRSIVARLHRMHVPPVQPKLLGAIRVQASAQCQVGMEVPRLFKDRAVEVELMPEGEDPQSLALSRSFDLRQHVAVLECDQKLTTHDLVEICHDKNIVRPHVDRSSGKMIPRVPLLPPRALCVRVGVCVHPVFRVHSRVRRPRALAV